MKLKLKSIMIFACMIVLTTGCTAKNNELIIENPTQYNHGTDYQYYWHQQGQGQGITESEDGYYFINGSYLYYMDKHSMEPVLLDNNPSNDCSPDKEDSIPQNCNAYINNSFIHFQGTITYYDNHLYVLHTSERTEKDVFGTNQYELIRMNKDGTGRKMVRQFDTKPTVVIHRNHIYFTKNPMKEINAENPSILSVPLANPKQKPTTLYTIDLSDLHFIDLIAYGDHLYAVESGRNMYRTIKHNLSSGENEIMYSEYEGNAYITGMLKDSLVFNIFTGDPEDEKSWDQYRSNLEGTDVSLLPIKLPVLSKLYVDENYYYLNPLSMYIKEYQLDHLKDEMIIYDLNYEEVERVDMSMRELYAVEIVGNSQHMFLRTTAGSNYERLYYLDKSTIGSGNAKLELLVESAAPQ
ncbi:hypothetical protein ACFP56_14345 [Paenibacillus septentrionalis]|uniref:DUF5050 domain-containing protein n=1 Tax=Paenibacillus septentrionalis TaxID=429342 RepID=A0ABW1V7U8_9BACL